jgi:hypothetical protein
MSGGLFGRLQEEMEAREKAAGLTMADVLTLPDDLRSLFNWMLRQGEVDLIEVVDHLSAEEEATLSMLNQLVDKGFVKQLQVRDRTIYRVRIAPKRGRDIPLNVWQALDGKIEE